MYQFSLNACVLPNFYTDTFITLFNLNIGKKKRFQSTSYTIKILKNVISNDDRQKAF